MTRPTRTTRSTRPRQQEHKVSSQTGQIRHQIEVESERNQLGNVGILRATSGNATKRLKSRVTTRAEKAAGAVIKQFATQELQAEKGKMQEWKENVMQEVARELQIIWQIQERAMETQRQSFQMELEWVRGKIEMFESKSALLETEIQLLKTLEQNLPEKKLPAKGVSKTSSNGQDEREKCPPEEPEKPQDYQPIETHEVNSSQPSQSKQKGASTTRKSYAQVAKENPTRSSLEKPWTEVKYANKKQATAKKGISKQEPGGRRILFPREKGQPKKSEEDIMLALNEALQKAGEPALVRFSRIGYSPSGAISTLLTEKADATELLKTRKNILIRAVKTIDAAVIGAEALEQWYRLKVHGMPLWRYLGEGKMELLKREVESSTGVQLKTAPRWLIHESRLRERQESENYRGSTIVITVASNFDATHLCARGLRFGGTLKVVERYWEAGPGSVCPICCGIGHDRLGKCGQRPAQCTLCAGPHKLEEHKCGVNGCETGFGKICTHVTAVCANCKGNHQATSSKCLTRQKAEREARKRKSDKPKEKKKTSKHFNKEEERVTEEPEEGETGMDIENNNWAGSPAPPSSIEDLERQESQNL